MALLCSWLEGVLASGGSYGWDPRVLLARKEGGVREEALGRPSRVVRFGRDFEAMFTRPRYPFIPIGLSGFGFAFGVSFYDKSRIE